MVPIVSKNKGFSLVEMMIAMVIIMISMLALLTSIITTTRNNMVTEQRNTAIRVTNQIAEALFATSFNDDLVSDGTHSVIDDAARKKGIPDTGQNIKGYRMTYSISWEIVPLSSNVKRITILVTYMSRGNTLSNSAVIFKNKAV